MQMLNFSQRNNEVTVKGGKFTENVFVYVKFIYKRNELFALKVFDNAPQCFASTTQANFPAHSLNFH